MLGRVCYGEKAGIKRELFGDTAVFTAYVMQGEGVRCALQARRMAAAFERKRIRLAAFPPDYPYAALFVRRGVRTADVTRLHRTCAAAITCCVLRQNGISAERASVVLVSKETSKDMHRAAHELARTVRYLSVCAPDAQTLACALRWEYGMAVKILKPEQTVRADLAVSFDEAAGEGSMILLSDKKLEVSYRASFGEKTCTDAQLLAALTEANAVKSRDLCVERVNFPPKANFS